MVVYWSTYLEFKMDFIAELHDIMDTPTYPILSCGILICVEVILIKVVGSLISKLLLCSMIG